MWQLRLQKAAKDYSEQRYEVVKTGWMIYPLGAVSTLFAYAVLLFWGVRLVRLGQLSIGEFVALQSYVLMLQGPLTDMGDCIAEWQRGFASFARMVEIFNLQSIADRWSEGKVQPPALAGLNEPNLTQSREASLAKPAIIEVNDLSFAFPKVGAGRPVFENLTLAVRFGENIGICGPLGSGKSTLLSLLAGLIEAPRGRIQLAGTDICELDHSWLANHVAMVPQRAFLFAGTIRYSLELDATYPEQELWRVLEVVRLAEDVRRFPDGLDSWVGEWGVNLSGGQKQRLALARALLRERSVLLLDDCLSAVDAVTEEAILLALKSQLHRVTVVWVAHRLSTLKLCDRVYRLADGSLQAIKVPGLQATVDEDHHDSYSH
jgi:ATP-binding cassette subfamily B protein